MKSPPLRSATATVDYSWPWRFLLFGIVGGILGGCVRRLKAKDPSESTWVTVRRGLLPGALGGILGAVLAAAEIHIFGWTPSVSGVALAPLAGGALGGLFLPDVKLGGK